MRALIGVDPKWIVAGVACFLCYYVFGVLAYAAIVVVDHDSPVGFRDLMSVEASGVFFMRLTPGGAGVIPSQIYRLTRAGLSLPDASALQFVRFTLYEAGEGIFAAIMLLLCGDYFLKTFADVKIIGLDVVWIGIFMFGFKFIQVGGVLLLCLLPGPIQRLGALGLRMGRALHILNDERYERYLEFLTTQVSSFSLLLCLLPGPIQRLGALGLRMGRALHILNDERYERYLEFLTTQVSSFSQAFRSAASNWHVLPAVELLTLLQLGCMYALPYFVLRSFGLEADLLICLASGSMVELLVNAIPLPGGAGGAEVGFTYLFRDMFGWHLSAGLVIWRTVEYLLPVVIAAPCMGMRSTTGESIYHRWNRRLENTVHVAHGDWGSVKRPAGIAYRPPAQQPLPSERKVTRTQAGDLTVKMGGKGAPAPQGRKTPEPPAE